MNRAFIFPGQGSQTIGMGKDFYESFPIAKQVFDEVNDTLNYDLKSIIFNGADEQLNLTINTQPALMAVSIAILRVLLAESKQSIQDLCGYVAGHSLGEYSALCGSGSLSLFDTTKLLAIRSRSMQEACGAGVGAMAACLGVNLNDLQKIVDDCGCEIANDNIEGQVVISGYTDNIEKAISTLKERSVKAIKLKVSAPFHCSLMKPAEEKMIPAINLTEVRSPIVPLIANVSAEVTIDHNIIKQNLISQICGRVRWRETIDRIAILGVDEIVEIGSGKVLTNMLKKSNYNFKLTNISNIQELEEFLTSI